MKYKLNRTAIDFSIDQEVINDSEINFFHHEPIDAKSGWFKKGYIALKMPKEFWSKIYTKTRAYINQSADDALLLHLKSIERYHRQISSDEMHMKVIKRVGKLLSPELLGVDVLMLEEKIKMACNIKYPLTCRDICDIRIFRPYRGQTMDNNPLHRDTWLPILNHCINVYIPIAGNTKLSSLSLIPGSHHWERSVVERTASNAFIKGVQYGLPSVAYIKRKYKIIRPTLADNEVLLFSSNIIHGGAVNLNKDITRVSIEIRFWPQELVEKSL